MSEESRMTEASPVLAVSDVAGAVEFFTNKLGFEARFQMGDPVQYAIVARDDVTVHLDGESDTNLTGRGRSEFEVSEVEAYYAALEKNGVTIGRPFFTLEEAGIKGFMALDPEGNRLGFHESLV